MIYYVETKFVAAFLIKLFTVKIFTFATEFGWKELQRLFLALSFCVWNLFFAVFVRSWFSRRSTWATASQAVHGTVSQSRIVCFISASVQQKKCISWVYHENNYISETCKRMEIKFANCLYMFCLSVRHISCLCYRLYTDHLRMNEHFRRDLELLEERMMLRNSNRCQQRNALFDLKVQLEASDDFTRSSSSNSSSFFWCWGSCVLLTVLLFILVLYFSSFVKKITFFESKMI